MYRGVRVDWCVWRVTFEMLQRQPWRGEIEEYGVCFGFMERVRRAEAFIADISVSEINYSIQAMFVDFFT